MLWLLVSGRVYVDPFGVFCKFLPSRVLTRVAQNYLWVPSKMTHLLCVEFLSETTWKGPKKHPGNGWMSYFSWWQPRVFFLNFETRSILRVHRNYPKSQKKWRFESFNQMRNLKAVGWLGLYRGWATTQLYRNYSERLWWNVTRFFFISQVVLQDSPNVKQIAKRLVFVGGWVSHPVRKKHGFV